MEDVIIFNGGTGTVKMRQDVGAMMKYVNKVLAGEETCSAEAEDHFVCGCRHERFLEDCRENTAAANADPNVIMPIDVMREHEKIGFTGKLHNCTAIVCYNDEITFHW